MATVSCGGTSARYRFIEKFGQELGIKHTCEWLGVSRSGFYAWLNREPSERDQSDMGLKILIKNISDENEGRYGSPRIWKALLKQGYQVSRKLIFPRFNGHQSQTDEVSNAQIYSARKDLAVFK